MNDDLISRQAAIEVIDAVFPVDPMKSEYAQGIACGAALAKTYVEQLPSAQPTADVVECVQRNEEFDRVIEELLEIEAKNDIGFFTSYERSQFNAYVEDLLSMTIERAEE